MSWDEITSCGHEKLCPAHDIILKKMRVLNIDYRGVQLQMYVK